MFLCLDLVLFLLECTSEKFLEFLLLVVLHVFYSLVCTINARYYKEQELYFLSYLSLCQFHLTQIHYYPHAFSHCFFSPIVSQASVIQFIHFYFYQKSFYLEFSMQSRCAYESMCITILGLAGLNFLMLLR